MLVITELCEVLFTYYFLHTFCLSWNQRLLCIIQLLCFPHTCPNSISYSILVVWSSSASAQTLPEDTSPGLWFFACLAHGSQAGICFHQIQGFPLAFCLSQPSFFLSLPFLGINFLILVKHILSSLLRKDAQNIHFLRSCTSKNVFTHTPLCLNVVGVWKEFSSDFGG